MTTLLSILSLVCIAFYTIAVCIKQKGIPDSISATFYKLEHKGWFGFTMFTTAILLIPSILEITPSKYQFVPFLACAGLLFIGSAPNFKKGIEEKIHKTGCYISVIFSQMWVALINHLLLVIWSVYLAYTIVYMKKNWDGSIISTFISSNPVFWIEIFAFSSTYLCCFLG